MVAKYYKKMFPPVAKPFGSGHFQQPGSPFPNEVIMTEFHISD